MLGAVPGAAGSASSKPMRALDAHHEPIPSRHGTCARFAAIPQLISSFASVPACGLRPLRCPICKKEPYTAPSPRKFARFAGGRGGGGGRHTPKPCDEHHLPALSERHRPPQTPKLMRMMRACGAPKSTPQVRLQKQRFERQQTSKQCMLGTTGNLDIYSILQPFSLLPATPDPVVQELSPEAPTICTQDHKKREARRAMKQGLRKGPLRCPIAVQAYPRAQGRNHKGLGQVLPPE